MPERTYDCGCRVNSYGIQEYWCEEDAARADARWKKKSFWRKLPRYLLFGMMMLFWISAVLGGIIFLILFVVQVARVLWNSVF